jgi:hypothetical protein
MPTQMTDEEVYEAARKRVEEKKGFRNHFIIYLCVNALLVIIWAVTGRGDGIPWFLFPLCGWGIGVLIHFLNTHVFSREADDREIEKEAEKIRKRRG